MSKYTKGPWEVGKYPNGVETHIYCDDATGSAIACADFRYVDRPKEEIAANLRLMATAPDLLEEAKSTNQGYDWFREQLEYFKEHQGSWTLEIGDDWADSLIAHINSRQIGTRAVIARAEAKP